jgi:vacuolar-type H+-ATPase subunit D/Vma8
MADIFDKAELEARDVLRFKSERSNLRRHKRRLKMATVVTPELRAKLDSIDNRIRVICDLIFHITGERE